MWVSGDRGSRTNYLFTCYREVIVTFRVNVLQLLVLNMTASTETVG